MGHDEQRHGGGCDDRCGARSAIEEREFTELLTGPQRGHVGALDRHARLAGHDDERLVGDHALGGEHPACLDLDLVDHPGDPLELARRARAEQLHASEVFEVAVVRHGRTLPVHTAAVSPRLRVLVWFDGCHGGSASLRSTVRRSQPFRVISPRDMSICCIDRCWQRRQSGRCRARVARRPSRSSGQPKGGCARCRVQHELNGRLRREHSINGPQTHLGVGCDPEARHGDRHTHPSHVANRWMPSWTGRTGGLRHAPGSLALRTGGVAVSRAGAEARGHAAARRDSTRYNRTGASSRISTRRNVFWSVASGARWPYRGCMSNHTRHTSRW
jgi:hypothetical protein